MDDRKKDQSIQSHANFDGDSATGDRTQIRQDQQNQQPPQIDPSLPTRKPWPHRSASIRTPV